jgi:hypothetical protein
MNVKTRKIEVDAETADLLEARAAGLGMSISALLAEIAGTENLLPPDLARMRAKGEGPWSPESLEEDARRLAEFDRSRMGAPWDEVKAWIQSWGEPDELPAPKPRKL